MRGGICCILFFLNSFGFSQQADQFINAGEANRIISHLAADSLKGRGNFTVGLEKAATFIANDFRQMGLVAINDHFEYFQPFIVSNKKYDRFEEVYLNNSLLQEHEYIFVSPTAFPPGMTKADFHVTEISNPTFESIVDSFSAAAKTSFPQVFLLPGSPGKLFKELQKRRKELPATGNIILIIKKPAVFSEILLRAKPEIRKSTLFNVIGILPGTTKPGELVIISAHYDHVGTGKAVDGDSIYNGANDNASGTAAMLMLANYFAAKKNNERTILFVAFAGEEIGLTGSNRLAQSLNISSVIAMLNFEMLGKPNNSSIKNECMITGARGRDIPKVFKEMAKANGVMIQYDNFPEERLYERSDHFPFSQKGVPAYTILNFSKTDATYHQPSDETQTLDLENMSAILKGILPAIEELVSGRFTPKK